MEKTKKEKEKEKEKNMNKNKNSRRKRAVVQDSTTNRFIFCTANIILCSLVALLAVPTVAEESASRGFMDTDIGGRGGGGGGGSAVHLKGRELGDVNGSWFDSDLQICLVDEKIWDQFEASDKLTGRRATYNKSLDTTSLDMSKVGV